ncbi:MAG TPA: hypothetical protein VFK17_07440 [Gaiellaceae bacterium]|nr:hypothetical protein [Gaiellaceae bacterium]
MRRPWSTISGRLCRAKAIRGPATGLPLHVRTSSRPSRNASIVASPCFSGSYSRPPIDEPLLPSRKMKPPLKVASSRQRSPGGTSMGPRTGAFGGSYRPG